MSRRDLHRGRRRSEAVLVSDPQVSDLLARIAVLEAENAELRKRPVPPVGGREGLRPDRRAAAVQAARAVKSDQAQPGGGEG